MGKHAVVKADAKPCERFYLPARINGEPTGGFRKVPRSELIDAKRADAVDEILARIRERKASRLEGPVVGE